MKYGGYFKLRKLQGKSLRVQNYSEKSYKKMNLRKNCRFQKKEVSYNDGTSGKTPQGTLVFYMRLDLFKAFVSIGPVLIM